MGCMPLGRSRAGPNVNPVDGAWRPDELERQSARVTTHIDRLQALQFLCTRSKWVSGWGMSGRRALARSRSCTSGTRTRAGLRAEALDTVSRLVRAGGGDAVSDSSAFKLPCSRTPVATEPALPRYLELTQKRRSTSSPGLSEEESN